MARKIITKAGAYAKKKSMIVKHDQFPGFLCHPIGERANKKDTQPPYELEGTGMFFRRDSIIKVVSRRDGEKIAALIAEARATRSDAIDDLTKGMIARLENNIQDILSE